MCESRNHCRVGYPTAGRCSWPGGTEVWVQPPALPGPELPVPGWLPPEPLSRAPGAQGGHLIPARAALPIPLGCSSGDREVASRAWGRRPSAIMFVTFHGAAAVTFTSVGLEPRLKPHWGCGDGRWCLWGWTRTPSSSEPWTHILAWQDPL